MADIIGTALNDILNGTSLGDTIQGLEGDDRIESELEELKSKVTDEPKEKDDV